MKEVEVKEKRYVCDRCGGKHKGKNKISNEWVTEQEVCDSCSRLIDVGILDAWVATSTQRISNDRLVSEDDIGKQKYILGELLERLKEKEIELQKALLENTLDKFIEENEINMSDYYRYY